MTTSRNYRRWLGVTLGAGALLAAGCTGDPEPSGTFQNPAIDGEFALVAYDSCEQAEQQLRAAAAANIGPHGFGTTMRDRAMDDAAEGAVAEAAPGAARDAAAPEYSGTNVHESGVDEPDIVKTDGNRIVTIRRGALRVFDVANRVRTGLLRLDTGQPDGSPFGQPADLLLYGDHALVLMAQPSWGANPEGPDMPAPAVPPSTEPGTEPGTEPDGERPIAGPQLLLVDLTGEPRIVSEYTIDGGLVDARAVGGTVRVVVRSAPRLDFPQGDGASESALLAANREVIENAEVADWLPRYEVSTAGETDRGQVDCTALSHPEEYSGSSMLTVLSFDLTASDLGDGAPVSIAADGETVYSNGTSLYVASDQRWRMDPEPAEDGTVIYKFDTSQPGPPRYVAAGSVAGWLINQYAMSEWEGHLRVATTDDAATESTVYVLADRDGSLVETGSAGGLGKGERIYSVRFTGPIGYVVTFRETDPLYTLDLRDPAAPAVLGELKITGYSSYLHPVGDARLIGVGQEADESGVIQGMQVSLFDVSDLANPERPAQHHIENAQSQAEYDPHAFLWWPDRQLLVVPVVDGSGAGGALALQLSDGGFTELGRIYHPSGSIVRSLVIGDTLWTVSEDGMQANDLSTLDQTGWYS